MMDFVKMFLNETVEAALVFVADGEGSRARNAVFEAQDSGRSPRPWEWNPQSRETNYSNFTKN